MKNAYLRTIEAVIAVIIIFSFILVIMPKKPEVLEVPTQIKTTQDFIFDEILNNQTIRQEIFSSAPRENLDNFLERTVEFPLNYTYTICSPDSQACFVENLPQKTVYAKSIMVSNLTDYRIFRIYLWFEI